LRNRRLSGEKLEAGELRERIFDKPGEEGLRWFEVEGEGVIFTTLESRLHIIGGAFSGKRKVLWTSLGGEKRTSAKAVGLLGNGKKKGSSECIAPWEEARGSGREKEKKVGTSAEEKGK